MNLSRLYNRLAGLLALLGVTSYCAADENLLLALIAVPLLLVGWRLTTGPQKLLLPRLVVNLLLVAGVLWATVKIPGFIQRHVVRSGGTVTIGGILARTLAVQSVTRTVLRHRPRPAPRIDASTHTHHHYRRLRRVVLNSGSRP